MDVFKFIANLKSSIIIKNLCNIRRLKPQFVPVCFPELDVLGRCVRDVTERTVSPPDVMSSGRAVSPSQCAREKMKKWNLMKRSEEKSELLHLDETSHLLTEFGKLSHTRSSHIVYSETVGFKFPIRDT